MKRLSMSISAFLTGALFCLQPATAWAQAKSEPDPKPILEQVENFKKSVDGIVNNVKNDLDNLRKEFAGAQTNNLNRDLDMKADVKAALSRLDDLEKQLKNIEKQLKKLTSDVEILTPPTGATTRSSPLSAPATNRVILENSSDEDVIFILNQRTFQVRANSTTIVPDVPLGSMTYQVVSPARGVTLRNQTTVVITSADTLHLTASRP